MVATPASTTAPKVVEFNKGLSMVGGRPIYEEGEEGWRPTFDKLPVISFKDIDGTLEERKALAEEVGAAFRDVGFFYAKDCPGVTPELIENTFQAYREFFALSPEEKQKMSWNNSTAAFGYEGFREAGDLITKTTADVREAFTFGEDRLEPEQTYQHPVPSQAHLVNQWPTPLPTFRTQAYLYYSKVFPLARSFLKILAMALGLEEDALNQTFEWPMFQIRCNNYLPRPPTEDIPGFGAHEDFSGFTFLAQEPGSKPCLEVLNLNGKWVSAPALPEATYVINCGKYLERLSNNVFVSTIHRATNHTGVPRMSLPLFFSPDPSTTLQADSSLWGAEGPAYPPLQVGQHYAQRNFSLRRFHPISLALKKRGIPPEEFKYEYMLYGLPDEE